MLLPIVLLNTALTAPVPNVVFNSFLETQSFFLEADEPKVRINKLQIAFAPESDFTCKLLVKEGASKIAEVDFRSPVYRAGVFTELGAKSPVATSLGKSDGPRTFEVLVNNQVAGSFTFNLTRTSNGDPLNPKTTWKIVGPWKDYAYLRHKPDDGNRQDIALIYWIAQHELSAGAKTVSTTMKKGSQVVASGRENYPNGAPYSRFELPLTKPNKDPLTVKDLRSMTGDYTIEVKCGAKVLRTWNFAIKGGAIVAHPRSEMAAAETNLWLSPRTMNGNNVSPFTQFWLGPK